jgi:hypothetical protein
VLLVLDHQGLADIPVSGSSKIKGWKAREPIVEILWKNDPLTIHFSKSISELNLPEISQKIM